MLLSMTGYGKAEYLFADHKTIVEIRSVNSKQLDLSLKIASQYREKEAEIRAMLLAPLERGKVDVLIYTQALETSVAAGYTPINQEAVRFYMEQYKAATDAASVPAEVMAAILRFPDVMKTQQVVENQLQEEEWILLKNAIQTALNGYIAFRKQEGESLQNMFAEKLEGIEYLLAAVEPYEKGRVAHIRERLEQNLEKLSQETQMAVDKNRLEQEMIYYLEKLDITEEKVRLTNHIKYFRETMGTSLQDTQLLAGQNGVGKKLGFIAQEMGREINTLGSKSNQSEMQILVVRMKDILEQIKEQVLNVL